MKKNGQTLKEVLRLFLAKQGLQEGFMAAKAKFSWGEIMGELIERYTEKISIKDQVLYIKLKSPELREDLSYQKKEITGKINKNLGQDFIRDIFFY
ncbi:DUF721 domain-containing protein [Bacteroidetes bacterium endosymbiont of Geopemphigus sp.]|uniref:DUF721 domain-containing protein n=1 Tax=Bacteroidetes bacterium endosymbiont of Geopemphigus sp. TaxID=2047937 RepID=UPI000CD26B42|nr:DUF721 domain-containing protein [Bacteroidetes bacterium endosymbiont of Geopemphigus sp.]